MVTTIGDPHTQYSSGTDSVQSHFVTLKFDQFDPFKAPTNTYFEQFCAGEPGVYSSKKSMFKVSNLIYCAAVIVHAMLLVLKKERRKLKVKLDVGIC